MIATGIVHFGPGAFHRAHQAAYFDTLLQHDPRWGIAAVSLRSGGTIEALRRQHHRYTLAIFDSRISFRTIQAHSEAFGPSDGSRIRRLLGDPAVRLVTSTVTEKGYCLAPDGSLDFDHPDIVHDLARPNVPRSVVGWLALGLADRRTAGLAPFATLCCDNLSMNGRKLGRAVAAFANARDAALGNWIEHSAAFPDTMVDSITPATTDALRDQVRDATGYDDAIPVSRESYSAWVIEDALPSDAPDLAAAGAVLTPDVGAWERAKLRILNGAHSSLAYLGLLRGHATVAAAMADAPLAAFVERMVREDVLPTLRPSPIDLGGYASDVFERFRNPAIHHRLAQIAWDGSQKLPYRLLDTIGDAIAAGRPLDRLALPVAAWCVFVERQARSGSPIVDPLQPRLVSLGRRADVVDRLLDLDAVFPPALSAHPRFRAAVVTWAGRLRQGNAEPLVNDTGFL